MVSKRVSKTVRQTVVLGYAKTYEILVPCKERAIWRTNVPIGFAKIEFSPDCVWDLGTFQNSDSEENPFPINEMVRAKIEYTGLMIMMHPSGVNFDILINIIPLPEVP